MQSLEASRECPKCHQQFSVNGQPETEDSTNQQDAMLLTLNGWTVFAADSLIHGLPLPQQVEAEVCCWLKSITLQLDMMENSNRLYGKIVFDPLGKVPIFLLLVLQRTQCNSTLHKRNLTGDLFDFDIKKLDNDMLSLGFSSWMNTLASGEVLLDIVNGLIEHVTEENASAGLTFKWGLLPVRRMLHTAPNKSAICAFLLNHDCLFRDFLGPVLKAIRPVDFPAEPGSVRNMRQAVKTLEHIGHTLLRSCYTTREWTWKALMLVVMTLMALTGSLGKGLENIYCCLTGESDIEQLAVPQLRQAYQALKSSQHFVPADMQAISERQSSFPYKRVLKQGPIEFTNQLALEFQLE